MTSARRCLVAFWVTLLAALPTESAMSQTPDTLLLWPDGAPGALGNAAEDRPSLDVYRPAQKTTLTAVLVCPGGGYRRVADKGEGRQVALWLSERGIAAFVLHYRINTSEHLYGYPQAWNDARRALRLIRSHAAQWNVDADHIGAMGFSAGGHLAALLGPRFDEGDAQATDAIERVSCRPDRLALIYPLITFEDPSTDPASREMQLGAAPSPELIQELSAEKQVTSRTPPTFLVCTDDDRLPPENSVLFYGALRRAKVPAELHDFAKGGHGYGLGLKSNEALAGWPALFLKWLESHSASQQ